MLRRIPALFLAGVVCITVACTNKKVQNPIANIDSKQPDKVLFDKAMNALKHNQYDDARMILQTLINTYPDSEFLARAKLAVADSWYAEGGSTAMAQAEAEYNDFITFFPNMPEAAEAQLKIANIQYNEMEKPDRDYTHAVHAEDEYRKVILQYPDNTKVVAMAKQRLLQVQEVIAEREFRVADFYFLHGNYPAAIARFKSLNDKYPLYSKADQAWYTLGQSYEAEAILIRLNPKFNETLKANMLQAMEKNAGEAYSHVITRYPAMDRASSAKDRLIALHQPVPKPTKAAVAQNRAEEASRHDDSMMAKMLKNFSHHPDFSSAAKVGEPTLVDPKQTDVADIETEMEHSARGQSADTEKAGVEIIGTGQSAPGDTTSPDTSSAAPGTSTNTDSALPGATTPQQSDPNELKPNVAPAATSNDPNELTPNVAGSNTTDTPQAPPQQVNEIQQKQPDANGQTPDASASTSSNTSNTSQDDDDSTSSSKHKKKKGLKKVIPF